MKTILLILLSCLFSSHLYASDFCNEWEREKLGKIDQKRLNESSGIAVSRKQNNVFWTHNDSSDEGRLFAINDRGNDLGEFLVEDADAIDWEDIAMAPCSVLGGERGQSEADCLFIGDIGNNTSKRQTFTIYVVQEPILDTLDDKDETLPLVERIDFQYDKKPRNAEGFFVNRDGIWIFDKGDATDLFHLKFSEESATFVHKRKKIEFVTAAAINVAGDAFVLRSNDDAWGFEIRPDESVGDAFERKPTKIDIEKEPHGEGIAWDGDDLVTSSEGENSRLNRYQCLAFGKADNVDSSTDSQTQVSGGGCASTSPGNASFLFLFATLFFRRKRKSTKKHS